MGRTKFEVEAIAAEAYEKIMAVREQAKRSPVTRAKAKKLYDKKYAGLIKERENLLKARQKLNDKLDILYTKFKVKAFGSKAIWGSPTELSKENAERKALDEIVNFKPVSREQIERQIILAGDQGSDVIIRNIIKMYAN